MQSKFNGNIADIRAIEDCIRATKRYTEGIGTMRTKHPTQGEDFLSRVFCKYYEVCPDTEISWNMPAGQAVDWLLGDILIVNVVFYYNYRANEASVRISNGWTAINKLKATIPGFTKALAVINNGKRDYKVEKVAPTGRIRS